MSRFLCWPPLLLLLTSVAAAQTPVAGRVRAAGSHQPLSLVTVQASGRTLGTTDEAGRFSFMLPADVTSPTLTFSHLGYQPLTLPATQLGPDVELREQSYLIGEVEVSYGRLRQLLLRRWKLDSACVAGMVRKNVDEQCARNPTFAPRREEMYRSLFQSVAGQRREYRDKGVVKTWGGIGGTSSRLRWQFDEATRTINVEAAAGTKPTTVLELTAERLVVQRYDGFVYTWVPAEK